MRKIRCRNCWLAVTFILELLKKDCDFAYRANKKYQSNLAPDEFDEGKN